MNCNSYCISKESPYCSRANLVQNPIFIFYYQYPKTPKPFVLFSIYLAVNQIFFTHNQCILLGKKILKPILTDLICFWQLSYYTHVLVYFI